MTKTAAFKKQFQKALERLREIREWGSTMKDRDATIQRFEFTFDLTWKLLKNILEENSGIVVNFPKEVFRSAYKAGLINYEDTWLKMTDDRNESSHSYNQAFAEELFERIPLYLEKFEELEKIITPDPLGS